MSADDLQRLQSFATRLRVILSWLDALAVEVESVLMKETTQQSPEFHGQANK